MVISLILLSVIISVMALGVSVWSLIQIEAMKRSTHNIVWKPVDGFSERLESDGSDGSDESFNRSIYEQMEKSIEEGLKQGTRKGS